MPLDFNSFPLREIRKGRELQWDPHAIDFSRDAQDWPKLDEREQKVLLGQVVGFMVGERAVAHDLAPLQQALRRERGRMHEEMYITQQLFEESTHVEFFQRWIFEVLPGELGVDIPFPSSDPSPLLQEALPAAMRALDTDQSPAAQLRAVVVYHQLVEGVSAEVGYEVFYKIMDTHGIMPGLRQGIRNIQVDESRHIAFGTYLAQRIIQEHPDLRDAFVDEMQKHKWATVRSTEMLFDQIDPPYPFGLDRDTKLALTENLYRKRMDAVLSGSLVTSDAK